MKILLIITILFQSFSGYARSPYEPDVAWERKSVRVCWGDLKHKPLTFAVNYNLPIIPYTQKQKNWIKAIITKEFSIKELGIEFIGWEDCNDQASDIDVVLMRVEPPLPESEEEGTVVKVTAGQALLGEKGEGSIVRDNEGNIKHSEYRKSKFPYLNYVILSTMGMDDKQMSAENYLQMVALHEFGHTAGLEHQHIRREAALKDSNCSRVKGFNLPIQKAYNSTTFAGAYDPNSIMNYCFTTTLSNVSGTSFKAKGLDDVILLTDKTLYEVASPEKKKQSYTVRIGFSAQDKHAVKCLYKKEEESKIQSCSVPE